MIAQLSKIWRVWASERVIPRHSWPGLLTVISNILYLEKRPGTRICFSQFSECYKLPEVICCSDCRRGNCYPKFILLHTKFFIIRGESVLYLTIVTMILVVVEKIDLLVNFQTSRRHLTTTVQLNKSIYMCGM